MCRREILRKALPHFIGKSHISWDAFHSLATVGMVRSQRHIHVHVYNVYSLSPGRGSTFFFENDCLR